MNTRALHPLDETLMHQVPWPFGFAGTSDPRFYDRYWFAGVDPAGDAGFISGMALYKNIGSATGTERSSAAVVSSTRDGRDH
ncbi:hypothetical protein R4227_20525 [Gordonia amicalis]|uniref:hypothetical protein n=1 Tax=Gordonia amicalis TaxID=89053 RepID=UPI001EDD3926|nr:hypothetical protein [Gordonia amicalis]MDV7102434.1 hypothetical protein [Gordonia amicalis]UKO94248.1 hypothetical protein IHQ52_08915 [Gordonia amicalis]